MPQAITKTQRWLDLIAYLVGRRLPVTAEEIMERVPFYAERWESGDEKGRVAARRTFERDKAELRELGIPIETVRYDVHYGMETLEGYQITRRDLYLPYLRLVSQASGSAAPGGSARAAEIEISREDAAAAIDALRELGALESSPLAREARSALRKMTFDLEPDLFPAAPVLFLDPPGSERLTETLSALSEALLARRRVRFRYRGIYRGETTERDVAPYGLLFQGGHWYLIGHDALRDAIRVFRVGRIDSLEERSSGSGEYEIPADFDLSAYTGRRAWELGEGDEAPLVAEVLFRFPCSLWAARNAYGELGEERPDGAAVRRFAIRQPDPFLRWVLGLEGEAEILSPPELREGLRELAGRVAALYRSPDSDA